MQILQIRWSSRLSHSDLRFCEAVLILSVHVERGRQQQPCRAEVRVLCDDLPAGGYRSRRVIAQHLCERQTEFHIDGIRVILYTSSQGVYGLRILAPAQIKHPEVECVILLARRATESRCIALL